MSEKRAALRSLLPGADAPVSFVKIATIAGIVLGNLVPLAGVFYWGWELFDIFYLYWIENVIIGVFTLLRMLALGARGGVFGLFGSLFMCAFFTVHYGMFCMGHGMIMTDILVELPFPLTETNLFMLPWLIEMPGFNLALAGIFLVEAIFNFTALRRDIEADRGVKAVMFMPYGRIVILHLTIILGGMLSLSFGFPPLMLVFLIVLKIFYDIGVLRFGERAVEKAQAAQTR